MNNLKNINLLFQTRKTRKINHFWVSFEGNFPCFVGVAKMKKILLLLFV